MSLAMPTDVRTEIDTSLDEVEISNVLDRTAREIDRAYGAVDADAEDPDYDPFDDKQHRADFEAMLTALRIAAGRD